ncbi:hypothetical protein LEP1GSC191_1553 [Leptospira borgpetersenii serovar Mini str. 201000851]|nr:hypothetical protein LEP1GSC191_1553 [Leptospira borgpetersenii serovar Mini str. 201000851]
MDGEGISAYRQIYSGEIEIDGSAMKSTSYSPDLEYQYIRMETKFNPGNLSVDMMNPNATRFNAEMAIGIKTYIDNLQKNVETMFAQFRQQNKRDQRRIHTKRRDRRLQEGTLQREPGYNTGYLSGIAGDLKNTFDQEMGGLKVTMNKDQNTTFSQGSFKRSKWGHEKSR